MIFSQFLIVAFLIFLFCDAKTETKDIAGTSTVTENKTKDIRDDEPETNPQKTGKRKGLFGKVGNVVKSHYAPTKQAAKDKWRELKDAKDRNVSKLKTAAQNKLNKFKEAKDRRVTDLKNSAKNFKSALSFKNKDKNSRNSADEEKLEQKE